MTCNLTHHVDEIIGSGELIEAGNQPLEPVQLRDALQLGDSLIVYVELRDVLQALYAQVALELLSREGAQSTSECGDKISGFNMSTFTTSTVLIFLASQV